MDYSVIQDYVLPFLVMVIGGACTLLMINTKTLRDSRDDLEKRVSFLEAKSERDDKSLEEKDSVIEYLRQAMTGEVQLIALNDMVEQVSRDVNSHHNQALGQWGSVTKLLSHLDGTMTQMNQTMTRMVDTLQRGQR